MDHYHIWCDLKDGVKDTEFADNVRSYLEHLQAEGLIAGWRLTRRKLGLGSPRLPEFHILLETEDLAQLDRAFQHVATRGRPVEGLHHAVNSLLDDVIFGLYRDFPDPVRRHSQEKF